MDSTTQLSTAATLFQRFDRSLHGVDKTEIIKTFNIKMGMAVFADATLSDLPPVIAAQYPGHPRHHYWQTTDEAGQLHIKGQGVTPMTQILRLTTELTWRPMKTILASSPDKTAFG
ncbi:MAG: hypothetical protein R2857_09745 [Vampirovibrionales bacterium]